MNNDNNYNVKVIFEDGSEKLVYAYKLHNQKLDYWQGWECAAGADSLYIYQDEIYGGECKNDLLGKLRGDWQLFETYTTCKLERCSGCTADLMVTKFLKT